MFVSPRWGGGSMNVFNTVLLMIDGDFKIC